MKRFSERKGHRKVSDVIQTESMSDDLRNSIWNVLTVDFFRPDFMRSVGGPTSFMDFGHKLWADHLKKTLDQMPQVHDALRKEIRKHFFSCEWYEVYDFVEFVAAYAPRPSLSEAINAILERGLSGFRVVEFCVVDITDKQEVKMLEEVLGDTEYEGVTAHLRRSLELLSDRKSPDYRNSIKESISAVESMARIITDEPKATLGDALKILEKNGKLHPALKDGFSKLYGYTSDEEGVRHAMLTEPEITAADAKYFLLSCTSFVNYLKSKM